MLPFLNLNCGNYLETCSESSQWCLPPRRRPQKPIRHSDSLTPCHVVVDGHEHIRVLDVYNVLYPLGKGTYGEVLLAKNKSTGARRAVKIVDKSIFSKTKMEYVWRESSVLLQVDHPNLVRLYESFENNKSITLVLELCDGGDLLEVVTSPDKRLSEPEIPLLYVQVLSALRHLHSHSIVHRDVKPENYLFTQRNPGEKLPKVAPLKLIDFGLSRNFSSKLEKDVSDGFLEDTDTVDNLLTPRIGTGEYMAPEIKDGQHADRLADRADMWSAGVVLHALLTGHFPNKSLALGPPDYYFKAPYWDSYSPNCRALLKKLLHFKPEERLSACVAMEHPWLMRAAGLQDFTVGRSIAAAIHTFAALPALKRLVLLAAAREVNDCEIYNVRMLFHNLELECQGVLSHDSMRSMLERALDESKVGALTYLVDVVEALYENMNALDTTSSGTVDWTEFVAAALCSSDTRIWSHKHTTAASASAGDVGAGYHGEREDKMITGPAVFRTEDSTAGLCSRAQDLLRRGNGMVSCRMPAASALVPSDRHSELTDRRMFLT